MKTAGKLITPLPLPSKVAVQNCVGMIIFTDSKRWVIELTEDKTLWYNYNFFKQIFSLTSLDVVQNQHLITKWVEDNIINKVKDTRLEINITEGEVDDIIQDGVKKIRKAYMKTDWSAEDTIQNGVKETQFNSYENKSWVEGVIKGGVKETKQKDRARLILDIDGRGLILETNLVIRDGVKETNHVDVMKFFDNKMEDTLENGVKSSTPRQYVGENIIDKIIDKGVIETHREICEYKHTVEHIIQTGVKETIECDWKIPKYVINEVIIEGVKKTMEGNYTDPSTSLLHIKWETQIEDVIDNGNKVCGTYVGGHRQEEKTETVIEYGKQI